MWGKHHLRQQINSTAFLAGQKINIENIITNRFDVSFILIVNQISAQFSWRFSLTQQDIPFSGFSFFQEIEKKEAASSFRGEFQIGSFQKPRPVSFHEANEFHCVRSVCLSFKASIFHNDIMIRRIISVMGN